MDAELVDDARLNGVLAAPVAEDKPSDLRWTPDEELETPDVRIVVVPRRRREEDGAPPLREAPESKDLLAGFSVVGRQDPQPAGEDRGGVGVVFIRLGERLGLTYT